MAGATQTTLGNLRKLNRRSPTTISRRLISINRIAKVLILSLTSKTCIINRMSMELAANSAGWS
ncbi:MAG: hypothetical protein QXG69_05580 [Candidatus Caldarchaeum sp.]|uniref:Uncharacterized protein n=1 Tax=Caldiarchaeum subterraneum TaxID=311458 RepID=A0A7C5L8F4_CALS0